MTGLQVAVATAVTLAGMAAGAGLMWRLLQAELDQVRGELDAARERMVVLEGERNWWRREAHRWWRSSRSWKRRAIQLRERREVPA